MIDTRQKPLANREFQHLGVQATPSGPPPHEGHGEFYDQPPIQVAVQVKGAARLVVAHRRTGLGDRSSRASSEADETRVGGLRQSHDVAEVP